MDAAFKTNDAARRELRLRIDYVSVGCAVHKITDFSYPITIRTNSILNRPGFSGDKMI
ncbi:MAG: hypothetical protein RI993_1779 [Pseudomonadota bacterium]|jgi:hypothetical protein